MTILLGCWVCIFDTQKVPEMRNIGLTMWPQLDQNSIVPHKTTLHAKFKGISSIGGHLRQPPVWESGLCYPLLHVTVVSSFRFSILILTPSPPLAIGTNEIFLEVSWYDKKIFTPPLIRICPLFDEPKKGDFFTPLPPIWTNVSSSAIFFFWRHPLGKMS